MHAFQMQEVAQSWPRHSSLVGCRKGGLNGFTEDPEVVKATVKQAGTVRLVILVEI